VIFFHKIINEANELSWGLKLTWNTSHSLEEHNSVEIIILVELSPAVPSDQVKPKANKGDRAQGQVIPGRFRLDMCHFHAVGLFRSVDWLEEQVALGILLEHLVARIVLVFVKRVLVH